MPLDYSKWDAIELSDDEDFECHPNVDKKSMIRWKQAKIHKERREREDQRDLLKMEYETTEKFLLDIPKRLDPILAMPPIAIPGFLMALAKDIDQTCTDPMRKASMSKMENWPGNWEPPVWGDVLRNHTPWNEQINEIMQKSEEYMKKGQDLDKSPQVVMKLFDDAFSKFRARQPIIKAEIDQIEKKMKEKLTMDDLIKGPTDNSVAPAADKSSSNGKTGEKVLQVIHNPKPAPIDPIVMDIFEDLQATDADLIKKHPQLIDLSEKGNYGQVYQILKTYPEILADEFEEVLLLRALCLSAIGKLAEAKVAVQNAQIIKFSRNLGANGVEVFFSRLQGTGSSAQNLFFTDLNTTLDHITKRGAVLRQERLDKKKLHDEAVAKKKEIYDSFLQPDGTLMLSLPENPSEVDFKQKEWFDNLPEDYKQGLLLEDVEKINAYLGSLPPEEAEFQANIAAKSGFIQFEEEEM